jgi:hypothetical protein
MVMYVNKYINIDARKWIILVLGCMAMSYFVNIWPVLFIVGLSALNAFMLRYERYMDLPIDIELSTFSAILMALKYGVMWGIIAGIATKMAVMVSNRDFNRNSIVSLSAYVLAAIFAAVFSSLPILYLGLLVTLLVNLFSFLVMRFVFFVSEYEIASYTITNVLFNVVIFVGISEFIFRLIPVL